jgi:hypothetical protein
MSQTMGCNEPLPADMQRVQRLSELVFADGSKLTIDTLLVCITLLHQPHEGFLLVHLMSSITDGA